MILRDILIVPPYDPLCYPSRFLQEQTTVWEYKSGPQIH